LRAASKIFDPVLAPGCNISVVVRRDPATGEMTQCFSKVIAAGAHARS
jgi:hypothetical protein